MRRKNEDLKSSSTPVDLTSDWTSPAIWLGHIAQLSIQLTFSEDPEGSFKLQGSCDEGRPETSGATNSSGVVNWTDIADSSQAISATGSHMYNIADCGYDWVRVVWEASGASGQLDTSRAVVKGV